MCTLIVLNECVAGYPLIVAANRDERYDRKSHPPELVDELIRPWDEEKDGTWMGVRRGGWFVGITNQDDGKHDSGALSRGKIVDACLHAETHCDVAKILKALDLASYNPFNLVFGRPGAMFLVRAWQGHELEMLPLEPGINVISNDCWGHAYDKKCDWARRVTRSMIDEPPVEGIHRVLAGMMTVMASHHAETPDDPFQSLCVHAEAHQFGTRSTSIITVSNEKDIEYYHSEGHPCQLPRFMRVGGFKHSTEVDNST